MKIVPGMEEVLVATGPVTDQESKDLDAAIKGLASLDPRQAQLVELRFFGGLSIEEAASVVNISPATAKREWTTARVWLHHAMESGTGT